jgi:hypothetical protein
MSDNQETEVQMQGVLYNEVCTTVYALCYIQVSERGSMLMTELY